ncbi:TPA: polysaccharide biosynthesis protein [Streptococcus suis]
MESKSQDKKIVHWVESLSKTQRVLGWLAIDSLSFVIGSAFALLILFGIIRPDLTYVIADAVISIVLFIGLGRFTKVRTRLNRYLSLSDIAGIVLLVTFVKMASTFIVFAIWRWIVIRYVILTIVGTTVAVLGARILWHQVFYLSNRAVNNGMIKRKVVLLGAGDGGAYFMDAYHRNPGDIEVVAVLDRDPSKQGQMLRGVKIIGDRQLLPQVVEDYGVTEAIIAIPSLDVDMYEEILELTNKLGIKVSKMPKVEEVVQGLVRPMQALPKVNIADLLGRKEVELDESLLRSEIENKHILVTGAGGSIGSEIVRQVSRFNPRKVVLLGHGENSIYNIYHEMIKKNNMVVYKPVIADIQDKERLLQVFKDEKPDIVYHAAAHKHVPLMEMNPIEAYKNNIIGTYNVASAVDEAGVSKMVMISSDKAVNPPNVMGASKRVAELIVTGIAAKSQSVFCAVRFGNVLGSRGSVIPVFEKQIEAGGPVTVTDFRMTRYFMTIPEASKLVIHAGAFAQNGEVFVLDMGEPVKIVDLARKLILLSGKTENEIEIVESGIRPGEKLFEELLLSEEQGDKKIEGKIFVGNVAVKPLEEVQTFINDIKTLSHHELRNHIVEFANEKGEEICTSK